VYAKPEGANRSASRTVIGTCAFLGFIFTTYGAGKDFDLLERLRFHHIDVKWLGFSFSIIAMRGSQGHWSTVDIAHDVTRSLVRAWTNSSVARLSHVPNDALA
jgi:hypothetical protein